LCLAFQVSRRRNQLCMPARAANSRYFDLKRALPRRLESRKNELIRWRRMWLILHCLSDVWQQYLPLQRRIQEQCREKIADYDAQEREDVRCNQPFNRISARRHFPWHNRTDVPPAYYGYALEMICESIGRALPYEHFSHLNSGTFRFLEQLEWIRDHLNTDRRYPISGYHVSRIFPVFRI